jgi:hypothetical protein
MVHVRSSKAQIPDASDIVVGRSDGETLEVTRGSEHGALLLPRGAKHFPWKMGTSRRARVRPTLSKSLTGYDGTGP